MAIVTRKQFRSYIIYHKNYRKPVVTSGHLAGGERGRMDILNFIPVGKRSAVDRKELQNRTGLDDRNNRMLIEVAWKEHKKAIINDCDGEGYYVVDQNDPNDIRNLLVYIAREEARKRSISEKLEIAYSIVRKVISDE